MILPMERVASSLPLLGIVILLLAPHAVPLSMGRRSLPLLWGNEGKGSLPVRRALLKVRKDPPGESWLRPWRAIVPLGVASPGLSPEL